MKVNVASRILSEKQRLLDEAGYVYDFDRSVYFNRNVKKLFSVEYIEDHSEEELQTLSGRTKVKIGVSTLIMSLRTL